MMNKKMLVFGIALIMLCMATGTVFAQSYQCKDPIDGSVNISFNGSTVYASYSGRSAQSFDVFVMLEDGSSQILSFNFTADKNERTRIAEKSAKGPVKKVTNCSFKSY